MYWWDWTCGHAVGQREGKEMEKNSKVKNSTRSFENGLRNLGKEQYVLTLYVTGTTPRAVRAIENVREICETHLKGHYELTVIDIYQQPALAKGQQIIAVPTLIKKLPPPLRRIIGDLSDREQVLYGLDLKLKE
jgi:circadian clock protein KaiB